MFSLLVLWALPCSSGPGPGLLAGLRRPVPPCGSSGLLPAECIAEFIKFYGHRGERPLAGCVIQEVCRFLQVNIYSDTIEMSLILTAFLWILLAIIDETPSPFQDHLVSSVSIVGLKMVDVLLP